MSRHQMMIDPQKIKSLIGPFCYFFALSLSHTHTHTQIHTHMHTLSLSYSPNDDLATTVATKAESDTDGFQMTTWNTAGGEALDVQDV